MSNQPTVTYVPDIRSELVSYPARSGLRIAAYLDHPPESIALNRVVVLSPKYGESKKNNLQLGYYLAANGFTVLRFDFTCHFGESEGSMLDFTLPAAVDDTLASLDYLEREHGVSEVTLLASSLSAVTAFRAASLDVRVKHLMTIVGVVDLTFTLKRVYQEDLIGGYIEGRRYGVLDILGHEVNMDHFFDVTIKEQMHTLEGTRAAMEKLRCPVSFFPAANDAWVRIEDVETVAAAAARAEIHPIEGAMHEVQENPQAAELTLRKVVEVCRRHARPDSPDLDQLRVPERKAMFRQNKIERDRLREARPLDAEEDEFWGKYLEKYRVMEKMGDYQEYVQLLGGLLGKFRDGEILLDAGCGNGLFGVWVMRDLLARQKDSLAVPPMYFGMDLTDSGLSDAAGKHTGVQSLFPDADPVGLMYTRVDLDLFGSDQVPPAEIVQIADGTFDKIACSLLLSYLKSPINLLVQMHRVLRPGGRIVISSMKPFCDLSSIYRDFVEEKADRTDVESARDLLRAAGAIKTKQEQGYYVFFSAEELTDLLTEAGFRSPQAFNSLGNQAHVVTATK